MRENERPIDNHTATQLAGGKPPSIRKTGKTDQTETCRITPSVRRSDYLTIRRAFYTHGAITQLTRRTFQRAAILVEKNQNRVLTGDYSLDDLEKDLFGPKPSVKPKTTNKRKND